MLLSHLGIAVRRVPRAERVRGVARVPIGRFHINIPRVNPLATGYVTSPDYSGELGRLVAAVARKYPGRGLIDVGANVGDTAAIAKNVADIPILCVEGDPHSFAFLRENMKQFAHVTLVQAFLDESSGTRQLRASKVGWNATLVPATGQGGSSEILELLSLDDVIAAQGSGPDVYKILKIDAEGFDLRILRGSSRFVSEARPVLYFEYNRENLSALGEDGLQAFEWLRSHGYTHVTIFDARGQFITEADLSNTTLIEDLHRYARHPSPIVYYDVCAFHLDDADVAQWFAAQERTRRPA
ncbi:MAG TPA: FkbM family methyltransferase [Humisphaera sp.]